MSINIKRLITALGAALMLNASPIHAEEAPADKDFKITGDAKKGQQTFQTLCLACHGINGDGKGPAGAVLNPPPGDFTNKEAMAKNTDKYLFTIIKEGGTAVKKSPLMVPWKAALNDEKIHDVAAYVKTFAKPKEE